MSPIASTSRPGAAFACIGCTPIRLSSGSLPNSIAKIDDPTRADFAVISRWNNPSKSRYWSASVRECRLKSSGIARPDRSGTRRSLSSNMITTVPASSGMPITVRSKKRNPASPISCFALEMSTFTRLPVSTSIDPACAANASGIISRDGDRPDLTAARTTTGNSAETAPLTPISAARPADSTRVSSSMRWALCPACRVSSWPAQAVTPEASRLALTTKSEPMNSTVGSPKPASA